MAIIMDKSEELLDAISAAIMETARYVGELAADILEVIADDPGYLIDCCRSHNTGHLADMISDMISAEVVEAH